MQHFLDAAFKTIQKAAERISEDAEDSKEGRKMNRQIKYLKEVRA